LRAARAAALTFGAGECDELEDDEGEEKKGPGAERERRPLRKELRRCGIAVQSGNKKKSRANLATAAKLSAIGCDKLNARTGQ
jgi:hypothetical protein